MDSLGILHLAERPLGSCTLATQQRTEIARALARDARVFLFDEPNSALTDEESDQLFREMRGLAAAGRIVILVSHRLGDLVEHTKRVAVIRDGRVTADLAGEALSEDAIGSSSSASGARRRGRRRPRGRRGRRPAVQRRRLDPSRRQFEGLALSVEKGRSFDHRVEGSGARDSCALRLRAQRRDGGDDGVRERSRASGAGLCQRSLRRDLLVRLAAGVAGAGLAAQAA
jgi:ABC-type sugar transport system ATPase subunit